jgi:Na+/H+ antiporter NhaD/arsenite permease-like protein
MLFSSIFVLSVVIFLIVFKEYIFEYFWLKLDNGTLTLFGWFLLILITKNSVSKILRKKVDYATLFFFAWLFIVVWALEYNGVIEKIAEELVIITNWSEKILLLMFTMWSSILSVFIDNVPYNIAMVSTLESFKENSIIVWTAWTALAWWLNSCTSIWWAWSPIWAACNVIALGQAEKSKVFINFWKYLLIWVPLVLINSFVAYLILYFRYLV